MVPAYLLVAVLTSALLTLSILRQTYLWQRKEYRLDRMWLYLTTSESESMRDGLLGMFFAAVGLGWFVYITSGRQDVAHLFGWAALLTLLGRTLKHRRVFRPQTTLKSVLAVVLSVVFTTALVSICIRSLNLLPLELATVLFFLPVAVAVAIAVTNSIAGARKRMIIMQAAAFRRRQPNLQVIAITGSVGKTSTKEYVKHIVEQAGKKAAATYEHRNSEFTVAQDMLEQLPSRPEIYIVEAAAYRRGEIAAVARLVQPHIGVVTAITNQHEGLFGSLEAVAQAKWELIEHLPEDGTAVLNADDQIITRKSKTVSCKTVYFSATTPHDIFAENIIVKPEQISCRLHIGNKQQDVTLPLVGRGAFTSALAAADAACAAGVSANQIFAAVESLPVLPRTMEIRKGAGGSTIIDDSYSASEASVHNAIEHLSLFPQRNKRIVLVPIIELSASAETVHKKIGHLLAASDAAVYIFGRAYEQALRTGAGKETPRMQWFEDPKQLIQAVGKQIASDSVILLEGRVPDTVRQALL